MVHALKAAGIYENTLIFFYSDNGGHLKSASSYPFRGHKGMLFEGGIRVPFLVSWPAKLKQSGRYSHPISALDIYPTVLAATEIDDHSGKPLDGVNLLPYLSGNSQGPPHQTLYWRYSDGAGYAVRHGKYKMVMSGYKQEFFLFNLDIDPYEHHNLASQKPQLLADMKVRYANWNKELIPAKWYDPHPENILKEENKRKALRQKAAAGERNN